MSKSNILTAIFNGILTGGRRTKAVDTRAILNAITTESYNENDGFIIIKDATQRKWKFTVGEDGYFIQPGEDMGF